MKKFKGISLISLIVTTIVIVVLTTAIVVNVFDTNIIGNANESVFKSDIATMQEQLNMYIGNQYTSNIGKYDANKLYATKDGIWYDDVQLNGTITDCIQEKTYNEDLPKSNVLYCELENDFWLAIRPSGTEPKIKFYMGVKGESLEDANELVENLKEAAKELM